jgi:hypothetical protein
MAYRDQQIVSFAWHHRSDREKPNNDVVAAKRRRNGIITRSLVHAIWSGGDLATPT